MMKQGENVTVEQEQILTFHEEGEIARTEIEDVAVEQNRLKDLDDILPNDVIGFLKRPIHYSDFEWLATNPDAVELVKEVSLPGDWLKQTMILEKLQGFRYLQCDFKVRVQVNAQPFNAGYLMMVYIPLHQQNQRTPTNVTTFSGITGYRRVMLDLSEDTSAEITIPYNHVVSHFDLIDRVGYLGVVKLYVYSPLTGSDNVDGTVWVTAENIKVSLPTGLKVSQYDPKPNSIKAFGTAHAGAITKKDAKLTTNPPKEKGTISSIADTVGSVAGVLKNVPVIGSVASTVEWASSAVSSVASFFGFSKPVDCKPAMKETLVVANNFANYDGDSKAKSLAFFSENETEIPTSVFGTEQDEMSFSHILAQPNYLTRFKMSKNNPQGTVIWKWPVDPLSCQKIIANDSTKAPYVPGNYICENTYLSLLSQFFKYYRGSLRYHIRIVKTAFHSGRIRVFVVPGATVQTALDQIDFNKVHSVVYDIRDTTTFDIEVPYKWNTPWKAIDGSFNELATAPYNITPNLPTAMIYIQVVNALRNPSTAADQIDFVVETSAADDFQFAVPMTSQSIRVIPSEEGLREQFPAKPMLASGPAHAGAQILDNAGGDQLVANKIAVGEVVTGWRTLLKRYARFLTPYQVDGSWAVQPWDSLAVNNLVDRFPDYFSVCDLMYRFKSGAIRLAAKTKKPVSERTVVTHEIRPHGSIKAQPDSLAAIIQSPILEPLVEMTVPFYQQTIALPTAMGDPIQYEPIDDTNYTGVPYNLGTHVKSDQELQWWRATAEDFAFGYLVGAPKTLMAYATRECYIAWRSKLTQLGSVDTYAFAYGPATEDKWTQYKTTATEIVTTAWGDKPSDELQKILDDSAFAEAVHNAFMSHSGDPAGSHVGVLELTQNMVNYVLPSLRAIFARNCSN